MTIWQGSAALSGRTSAAVSVATLIEQTSSAIQGVGQTNPFPNYFVSASSAIGVVVNTLHNPEADSSAIAGVAVMPATASLLLVANAALGASATANADLTSGPVQFVSGTCAAQSALSCSAGVISVNQTTTPHANAQVATQAALTLQAAVKLQPGASLRAAGAISKSARAGISPGAALTANATPIREDSAGVVAGASVTARALIGVGAHATLMPSATASVPARQMQSVSPRVAGNVSVSASAQVIAQSRAKIVAQVNVAPNFVNHAAGVAAVVGTGKTTPRFTAFSNISIAIAAQSSIIAADATDSTAPGYLAPLPAPMPVPLVGQSLNEFLQQVVQGITGLPGNLIIPRWQTEPPVIPNAFTAWCAIGITRRRADVFAYVGHVCQNAIGGNGYDDFQLTEEIELTCSFYDTGVNGLADYYAYLLRDGIQIEQNHAILRQNEMGFVECTELIPIPSLTKERWLYRVDETLIIRRRDRRSYPVLNLKSFSSPTSPVELLVNAGYPAPETIIINPPRS